MTDRRTREYMADVAATVRERAAREEARQQHNPDITAVINVRGRNIEVDAKGQPTKDRDRSYLEALAESLAQRNLDTTIKAVNRKRDVMNRLEPRKVTAKEAEHAYTQLLAEGSYRAKTGESGGAEAADFRAAVASAVGDDPSSTAVNDKVAADKFPEARVLDDIRKQEAESRAEVAKDMEAINGKRDDDMVYDRHSNSYRPRSWVFRDGIEKSPQQRQMTHRAG